MTLIGIEKKTLSLGVDIEGEESGSQHVLISLPPEATQKLPLKEVVIRHDCGHALNRREDEGGTVLHCQHCNQKVRLSVPLLETVGDLLKRMVKNVAYGGQLGCRQ